MKISCTLIWVALSLWATLAQAASLIDLGKSSWVVVNGNGSVTATTELPAYPLEVLRSHGNISDPLFRYGELESRWVALDNWTFGLNFSGSTPAMQQLLAEKQVLLKFGGIDTFATVTLNGQTILEANNFHRQWTVAVKDLLNSGSNQLVISIRPAMQESLKLKEQHPYSIPTIHQMGSIGVYNFIRKPASDGGWDWGPAYMASGIHGSVELVGFNNAVLEGAYVQQNKVNDQFEITVTSDLLFPPGGDEGVLAVAIPELGLEEVQQIRVLDSSSSSSRRISSTASFSTRLAVNASQVELWWPVGYGSPRLYNVTVTYAPTKPACMAAAGPAKAMQDRTPDTAGTAAAVPVSIASFDAPLPVPPVAAATPEPAVATAAKLLESAEADTADSDAAQGQMSISCADAVSSKTYRVGFRTIELVRLPIPQAVQDLFPPGAAGWDVNNTFGVSKDNGDGSWALSGSTGKWEWVPKPGNQEDVEGESFYFKVNGLPVYMKGANLVPMHILPTNVTKDMIHDILDYALESNMNMIRIWGGGMYPVPEVFDYCDEKGLLVWMETMFACAPYPRDVDFLDNVVEEVTQQVHRLSWHPSVAAWSGNNEIEGSLNWYSESRTNRQLFAGDYIALFIDNIRGIIKKANPSMAFVDSSPSNGAIVDTPQQYVKRWGDDWDPRYGDVHHYAYDADCEDWSTYPKAKFISEFGSQSYPTFQTYASVTSPEDWQMNNNMTGFRNRRFGNGLEVFEAQFRRHFRLPAQWSVADNPETSYKLFRSFLYITHMQQARCYEAAINYWRRLRSQPAGLNMGVLYWQLNDIAEFASWSSYDYGGRWKPLAYAVKRMYAPMQVQAIQDGNFTKVFVVNDHTTPVTVGINMRLLSLADNSSTCQQTLQVPSNRSATIAVPDAETTFEATVPPGFASQVLAVMTADILATNPGCSRTTCYLDVTVTNKNNSGSNDEAEVSQAQMFFVPLKDIDLPDPGLKLSDFQQEGLSGNSSTAGGDAGENTTHSSASGPVSFSLTASGPAVLTYLNTKYRGRFSDDAFTAVHPCKPKRMTFYPHESVQGLSAADLAADLTVESLFNHQFGTAAQPARS